MGNAWIYDEESLLTEQVPSKPARKRDQKKTKLPTKIQQKERKSLIVEGKKVCQLPQAAKKEAV